MSRDTGALGTNAPITQEQIQKPGESQALVRDSSAMAGLSFRKSRDIGPSVFVSLQ